MDVDVTHYNLFRFHHTLLELQSTLDTASMPARLQINTDTTLIQ